MPASLRDYVLSLCVLSAVMGMYQMTLAQWVKAPEIERAAIPKRTLTANDSALDDLYPDDAWQRGTATRLKTADGILLFRSWEQVQTVGGDRKSDGRKWELKPITIVVGRGLAKDGSDEPMLIEAEEGAVIEFDKPLDFLSDSDEPPSIRSGKLKGDVRIRRLVADTAGSIARDASSPQSVYQIDAAGERDASLDIQTANVWIDRRKIWTTEPIHMRVGQAEMVGRDLTLHLAATATSGSQAGGVTGALDRMELIYLRDLRLPLDQPGTPAEQRNGDVQIRCGGRIEYDFALDQLLLDRDVSIIHHRPLTPSEAADPTSAKLDHFDCQSLRLTLRDPFNSNRVRTQALDWIDRIEATGRPVRMDLPSQGLSLDAAQLSFDPVEGWLVAEPYIDGENTTPSVKLQHHQMVAWLQRIVYRFDPQVPKQLGTAEVDGAGVLESLDPASPLKSFAWADSLRISPLAVATPDSPMVDFGIWCNRNILANLRDGGTFACDRVEGVIKPVHAASPPSEGMNSIDQQWLPDRLAAIGNVQVDSPTVRASTKLLNLFFRHDISGTESAGAGTMTAPSPRALSVWTSQPSDQQASDRSGVKAGSVNPSTIRGDEVTAELTIQDGALTASDLSVIGSVEVVHPLKLASLAETRSEPLKAVLRGDRLRVRDGGGSDVLQIDSQDGGVAKLEIGDGYFVGKKIQIRPDDNYVWIPGQGEFVLPTAFLPSLAAKDGALASEAMQWTRLPRCFFGDAMTFDGQLAKLTGNVTMQATISQDNQPSEIDLRGDELQLSLAQPVSLTVPESVRATQLSQIALLQTSDRPVEVMVDRYTADAMKDSRHRLQVARLQWTPGAQPQRGVAASSDKLPLAGEIYAPGPGSYRGWFRTPVTDTLTGQTASTRNAGSQTPFYVEGMIEGPGGTRGSMNSAGVNDKEITGVHLVFRDSMRGDLLAKSLLFNNGVRVARKMVGDFDEGFDARTMDQLSQDELTLDCDQLRIGIDPSKKLRQGKFAETARRGVGAMSWELEAYGAVHLRARSDRGLSEATADRCGYTLSKDVVTIQGIPSRPARFQQTDLDGKPVANLSIRSMSLKLKPFELLSSEIESMQTGALPKRIAAQR